MASNRKNRQKSQSRHMRRRKLTLLVCFAVCAYFVVSIVSVQIEIYKEKQKLAEIQNQINETQLENDELSRIVYGAGEAEYIERIAREKLGYAAADERVFEDVAGSGNPNAPDAKDKSDAQTPPSGPGPDEGQPEDSDPEEPPQDGAQEPAPGDGGDETGA